MKYFVIPTLFTALALPACATEPTSNPREVQTDAPSQRPDAHPDGGRGGNRPAPDFAEAATTLGIPEVDLRNAMRDAGGRRADLAEVAAKLGVSEDALRAALPKPPQRRPGGER